MKSTKHLLLIIIALISLNVNAQEAVSLTVNVETAGTLPELIPVSQKNQITNLTLTGYLNGTDIRYIREMAGINIDRSNTEGKLSVLDLSKAYIVAGGNPYYSSFNNGIYYSSSNSIGNSAFQGCTGLTSITIPNSVTTIWYSAFLGCTRLTSVAISNSLTTIGTGAFQGCSGLTSVTIPNSVTTIEAGAFWDCSGLTSVTISNSVTTIGYGIFNGCSGLTSVTIPNSVTTIGEFAFWCCTGLTSVTIPNSVTTIGQYAFYGCTGLTSVTIPSNVSTIWDYAFRQCIGLTSVIIPGSVTTIGQYAFYGCNQIKQIYCKGTTPPKNEFNLFSDIYNTCELYVPKGAYSSYRSDPYWGQFKNIIEQVTTSISDIEASITNVYTENGYIVVKGGKLGDIINIYSVTGSLLHKIKITDDIVRISVAPQSLYIVKDGNRSFKIAM